MNPDGFVIAGMQGMTGLDFPGLVSAIVFTQGCNFYCPYCHNAHLIPRSASVCRDTSSGLLCATGQDHKSPAPSPKAAPSSSDAKLRHYGIAEEAALAFLRKRAGLLDGLVISGGEPTLQPGLAEFCRSVKALGYKVKLDTNGSRPEVLRQLLDAELLDYVAVDCKTLPERYYPELCAERDVASALQRTLTLLCASSLPYEIRTTCVEPFIDAKAIESLAAFLPAPSPALLPALSKDAQWFLQKANLTPAMRAKGLAPIHSADMERLAGLVGARIR